MIEANSYRKGDVDGRYTGYQYFLRQNAPFNLDPDYKEKIFKLLFKIVTTELTPRQELMFRMYYIEGLTVPEIAEELKINRSTVSRTKNRAMNHVKKYIKYSSPQLLWIMERAESEALKGNRTYHRNVSKSKRVVEEGGKTGWEKLLG